MYLQYCFFPERKIPPARIATQLEGRANAMIHWTGPEEADGCEWVIQIDSVYYHPNQLDNSFKQNQLHVTIEYHLSNEIYCCGFISTGLPVIIVESVRK